MRAIIIDPRNEKVYETNYSKGKGLDQFRDELGIEIFTMGFTTDKFDMLVDDEGLFRQKDFFNLKNCGGPDYWFAGCALITGSPDDEGDVTELVTPLAEFRPIWEHKEEPMTDEEIVKAYGAPKVVNLTEAELEKWLARRENGL